MKVHRWITIALVGAAAVAGVGLLVQRQVRAILRVELEQLREGQRELATVRSEHARLQSQRPADAELQRLRADHAALARLRAEVAELKARLAARQRTVDRAEAPQRILPAALAPALVVEVALGADGRLSVDGGSSELALLEQRLAGLIRGARIEVRLSTDVTQMEKAGQTGRRLLAVAKEHGLRMELRSAVTGR